MPEVTHMASVKPALPTVNPEAPSILTSPPLPLWEVHTIVIVVIFCVVCFLLLVSVFYASCFHWSIALSPKHSHTANTCNLEREDTTFRRTSSDNQSQGNVI